MFALAQQPRNFAASLRDLAHPKPEVRASAARDLRHHDGDHREQILTALARALCDDAGAVRAAAAETLADVRGKEALTDLLVRVEQDRDVDVRQMALLAIGAIGDGSACKTIEAALADEAPPVRFQAVIAYARCADRERAVRALLRATSDEDALVCHIALRMSEEIADDDDDDDLPADQAIVLRCRELYHHPEAVVRVAAAIIRARAGEKDARALLLDVVAGKLCTSQAEDEAAAIELCGELGLAEAREPLSRRAFSARVLGGDRFAWQARVALAQLGDEPSVRWILGELKAWTRERRTLGVAAAGRARLSAARPLLVALQSDPNKADPEAVADALGRIDEGSVDA